MKIKKYPLFFTAVTFIILAVFSSIVLFPTKQKGSEITDYSFFLNCLESKSVTSAELSDNVIIYETKNPDGSSERFETVRIDDPDLVSRLSSHGVSFYGSSQNTSPSRNFMVSWGIPAILAVLIFLLIRNKLRSPQYGTNSPSSISKSRARIYVNKDTGKSFSDVAGQEEAKEALSEIVDFLHEPEKFTEIGAKLPKGVLLAGPPGTGKTLLAQAVAGEADVPFFSISGSEFVEMFAGVGAAKIRDLFRQASAKAPCIVFIDEIDTIGKKRDSRMTSSDEREQTLNQLLTEMDGFDGRSAVVILAATNRPDSLDPALLRPGRFDRRIPVELPDIAGREAILRVHASKVVTDTNLDFNAIARATAGASGAELANIINEAALRAVRNGRNIVSQSDIEESVEVVIAGYQRKNAVISHNEKKIIAYHEIGHAIVAAKERPSAPVHKITIIPRTSGALGYTMQVDDSEKNLVTKEDALSRIAVLTGGRSAEELVFGTCTSGASNDIEKATRIARSMVTRCGMSSQFDMIALETASDNYLGGDSELICSSETAALIDKEVNSIIASAHRKALGIISDNINKLHELAALLLEKETISGDEFMAVLDSEKRDD